MCNLYSITTTQEAMRRLFNVKHDGLGNFPPRPALFPDAEIPIVRNNGDGERELCLARWGFPPVQRGVVTNIRNLSSRFWAGWLGKPEFRCLVPFTSFSEYHPKEKDERGHKKAVWFAASEERPLHAFAGLWRPWTGERKKGEDGTFELAAFCTTEANAVVKPIHPKAMPVILRPDDHEAWLTGSVDDAKALQRPWPDDELEIVKIGGKTDGRPE